MAANGSPLVAAIDFGTTYSGYAFSFYNEYKIDPLTIHANQAWNAGGRQLLSLKAPTCLLLNARKEFEAFGYDAENKYAELVMDDKQDDFYYFHRFKMNLYNNKDISSEMVVEDITGKVLPAIVVFTKSIEALKNHFIDQLRMRGTKIKETDIFWVLTVPAIWTDKAKQFMRNSAVQAGILDEKLLIALEPEAASIYCQYLPIEELAGSEAGSTISECGTKYMVIDIGGGTVDITVHEKLPNGKLKELTCATGNECGGTSVDGKFFQLLVKIFGGPLLKHLQQENPDAYLDLLREFETVKRTIATKKTGKVNLFLPFVTLDALCKAQFSEGLVDVVNASSESSNISVKSDKLRIDAEVMKELFKPTLNGIIECIQDVLRSTTGISKLLVVGGFAECLLVQETIREKIKRKHIIIPHDAGLAVLKGAVLFGRNPSLIQSRIMRFSYGVEVSEEFDASVHDKKYMTFMNDGRVMCDKIFRMLVKKDVSIETGTKVYKKHYTVEKHQSLIVFSIFISPDTNVKFTYENECLNIGKVILEFEETTAEKRSVTVDYVFGKSELEITAIDDISKKKITAALKLV